MALMQGELRCSSCKAEAPTTARFCPQCGAALAGSARNSDELIGQLIGGYRLLALIGEGGMGKVYRAEQERLRRAVCVKTLLPQFAQDPQVVQRFEREGLATAGMRHPNVVTVLDFGRTESGVLYIVMEYVEGRTLRTVLREDAPVPLERALSLVIQILSALDEAHALSIVHRDLKPGNVLVSKLRDGSELVKVVDFGIAKLTGHDEVNGSLTKTGVVVGTPGYMAPEQLTNQPVTPATDLYAAGVILWELLTGKRLFAARSELETLNRQLTQLVSSPSSASSLPIPPLLDDLCLKALERDPSKRFGSALEFRNALEMIASSIKSPRPPSAPSMLGPGPPANDEAAPSPASASDVLNALLPSQLANYTRTLATQLARSEKRTLHAFFLEVNTDFDAGLDSQRLRTSMTELFAGLSTLIEAHGGMGERFMGSCLVAIFGLRALAEDDAERCLHAAKQARAFVTEFAQRLSTTLTVRIGVCAATVSSIDPEAGLQDNPAVNEVLNLARKVESVAGPGEIVMTQRVRSAAKEAFLFEDGPTLHASAEPLYRLSGADETHATPPEPLAGRQREHQLLSAFLDHLKQRHSGGALLVGQPGIGKSRMLRLAVQLAQDRTIRVARAKGGRFGQAPLDTIRQLVHSVTFPERHDFDDVARTTLKGLARLGLENADIQRLENLFSMGPTLPGTQALADEERYHDRAALLEVFAKATKDQPLLLVIDDAHAADRLSLEVIEDIVARASDGHPLGLLCAARAGETDATLTRLKRIEIGPLSPNEMSHLIGDVLKRGQVPAGLHEAVWARCEGNPQYCKELVQSLAESGHLQFANGAWKFDPNDSELPDSLAHVVAARLERTSPHARTLLRLGAVIGRTFPIDLVAASVETPIDVSAAVDECLRRGLLERVEQFKGTLQFSQVLIRDSIVARLSAVDRRRLHQMVGEAIERGCSAGSEHPLDAMSRHFVGSEQPRKAMKYLRQAANRWVEKHAYDIAAKQYQEALQLLLREAARLGPMSITTAGHVLELAAAATHAQSMDDPSAALAFLDEATKDVPESVGGRPRAEAIRQRGLVLTKLSRPVEAAKDLKRALTFLTAAEDTAQVIAVRVDLAAAYEGAGQLAPATAELVEVLRLMGTRHTKDPNALWPCLNQLGRVHLRLGKPNEARSFFESALTAAEEASSPTGQGRVVANQMVLAAQEGDGALAERLYAKALSLSRAGGDRLGAIRLQYNHATWLRNAGRVRQADAELREVAQRARDLGWKEGEAMAAAIRTPTSVAGSGAHS